MTTDEDTLVLKRSLRRQIAVLLWWGIVTLGSGLVFLAGIENMWGLFPWLKIGPEESKSLPFVLITIPFGLFVSLSSVWLMATSGARRLIIDHEGITDVSLTMPFRPETRKFTPWSKVRFVEVVTSSGIEIPRSFDLDDGKSLTPALDGFSHLELAMPLIRLYVHDENIDHIVDWEPGSTLLGHDVVLLKPSHRAVMQAVTGSIPWNGFWLWLAFGGLALQRTIYLNRRPGVPDSLNPLPLVYVAAFPILLMTILVVLSLTLRYVVGSEGVALVQRSILLYRTHRKFCSWRHVHRIYTTRIADGFVPAQIIFDGGRVFRNLEQFADLEAAMDVIKHYAPESIIHNWDLTTEGCETGDISEAQPVNAATAEQVVLQAATPARVVSGVVGFLFILAGAGWFTQHMLALPLRAIFIFRDLWLSTLVILSCVSFLAFLLPMLTSQLLQVAKNYHRLSLRCVVDDNGLTFSSRKRKQLEVREQIPWEQVSQVFTYKTLSGVIPVEILLRDGRCIHLHRLFLSSHRATPLILRHVPPDAVKDWPFSCNPPGCKDPQKRR